MSKPNPILAKTAAQVRGKLQLSNPPQSVSLDYGSVCGVLAESAESPIDRYSIHARSLVVLATNAEAGNDLRNLLLIDLISSVESYSRQVIVGCLYLCELTRRMGQRKTIPIGAIEYYESAALPYAIFDHVALSGSGELSKQTENLLGFSIRGNGSTSEALGQFEKICNLRHAIVHARGRLSPGNLWELELVASGGVRCVGIGANAFQSMVAVGNAAVRAYNQFIFDSMLDRWINQGVLCGRWDDDAIRFTSLVKMFACTDDLGSSPDPATFYQTIVSYF